MRANARLFNVTTTAGRAALALSLALAPGLLVTGCKKGSPPTIIDPGDQVAVVGKTFTLNLFAADQDGDSLTFSFASSLPDINSAAMLGTAPDGHAVFTYTPVGGHEGMHIFDFIASDGTFETKLPISIDVRGATGSDSAPIFRSPDSGFVLNLTEDADNDCVQFDVVVEDADSTEVELGMAPPILSGAELSTDGSGLEGSFEWCPNRDQRQVFQHRVTLSADDMDNPPTLNEVPLVLRRPSGEGCPGEAPTIGHSPRDFDTLLDLEISADISDDMGLKSAPVIFYAYEDPVGSNGVAFEDLLVANMTLVDGDMRSGTWSGTIPNPTADQPEGTTADVWYIVEVIDDDDAEGECDHRTDSPPEGAHQVTVTNSGDGGGALCESCSFDVQCGDEDDLCVMQGSASKCGTSCNDTDGCPEGYDCSPDPVNSVDGAAARQCVPTSGICGGDNPGGCEDDRFEDDDNIEQAMAYNPVTMTGMTQGHLCPFDDDWVFVSVTETAALTLTFSGDSPPDMDIRLTDSSGEQITSSQELGSDEEIAAGCLDPGDYFIVAEIYDDDAGQDGDYTLNFEFDTAACQSSNVCCEESKTGGCSSDVPVETCVCAEDNFCCTSTWDDTCVSIAINQCNLSCVADDPGAGDCCAANMTPGCEYDSVESCACTWNTDCCMEADWTSECVETVNTQCGGC